MGIIVNNGLNNQTVRRLCTHSQNKNYSEIKKIQMEFSRFIGYCILFRNTENIDQYMLLQDKGAQIDFIKKQIAKKIEIPEQEIAKQKEEIIQFAFDNFKKNGYVFHAANSLSVKNKIANGLRDNDVDFEQQQELLKIEALYRKYNPHSEYSPLGHGATDIKQDGFLMGCQFILQDMLIHLNGLIICVEKVMYILQIFQKKKEMDMKLEIIKSH